MALHDLKKTLNKKMMKAMTSKQVMQLMSDPRFQKVMMEALQMQAKARKQWRGYTDSFARQFNLATTKDVKKMKRQIKDLEKQLKKMSEN